MRLCNEALRDQHTFLLVHSQASMQASLGEHLNSSMNEPQPERIAMLR